MKKLLLQLDSSRLPSVFDQVVAYDAGADAIMSYGNVEEADVRDLIHGCIFTRGAKDLKNTAVWIGGNNMTAGEQLLAMAVDAMFKPLTVSVMLDSNGSNTTAVAAVAKIEQALGDLRGKKAVILAGTGPVGQRSAGLLARSGVKVIITSRKPEQGDKARQFISARFNVAVESTQLNDPSALSPGARGRRHPAQLRPAGRADGAEVGLAQARHAQDRRRPECRARRWASRASKWATPACCAMASAVSAPSASATSRRSCTRRAWRRLFTKNDLVLDAEAIAEVAREMLAGSKD